MADQSLWGAIRWDGFGSGGYTAGVAENAFLGPSQWHDRVPFFGEITGANSVSIVEDVQSVIDRQIQMANACGLDYWAFDFFPGDPVWPLAGQNEYLGNLNYGLKHYLASEVRGPLKFCILLVGSGMDGTVTAFGGTTDASGWSPTVIDYLVGLFQHESYQKLSDGSPILMVYNPSAFGASLGLLRTACTSAGVSQPWIVGVGTWISTYGNALTKYNKVTTGTGETAYSTYAAGVEAQWATDLASVGGGGFLPTACLGWDFRSRAVPANPYGIETTCANWAGFATDAQIAAHIQAAIDFSEAHSTNCRGAITYSWNEITEGGRCLVPTLGDKGSGLQAIAKQLGRQREPGAGRKYRARGIEQTSR